MTTYNSLIRPKVLCFVDYYLPGYKGGGPIRTISNMVSQLGGEFDFLIVTKDRDLSDKVPYSNIMIDQWNIVGQAKVFYASPSTFSLLGVMRLLRHTPHDILYLNSFFSPLTTIIPLVIRRIGLYTNKAVIIAPRGEFSVGALALKLTKKKIYIAFANVIGIYRELIWQASSEFEYKDIIRGLVNLGVAPNTRVAPNISVAPDTVSLHEMIIEENVTKIDVRAPGPLRAVFLSRISPMKNLDYLLRTLHKVTVSMELSIYGTIEDLMYWSLCQRLIKTLPSHITVTYKGEVMHKQVAQKFASHDVFIFPTRGENFGHVIYESLSVGTPVIISDQTPWKSDSSGAVKVLSLDQPDVWTAVIIQQSSFNEKAYADQRVAVAHYAKTFLATNTALEQNRNLFLSPLGHSPLKCLTTDLDKKKYVQK